MRKLIRGSHHLALGLLYEIVICEDFLFFLFPGTCLDAGKAAQQINVPVPEGCTDPSAANFDPTARSDDGSFTYKL